MKSAVRLTSAVVAAFATAGVSTLFMGAAPANAASATCGPSANLVTGNICEQTFTGGTSTFTPSAQMSKLEVLLVGAGGAGADNSATTNGYATAGGGGQVSIVDFSANTTAPLTVVVGPSGSPSSVTNGTTAQTALAGIAGSSTNGGASGSGHPGAAGTPAITYGAGGGASASPVGNADGGAGVVVSSIAPSGSLFTSDNACYGGGGAVGVPGVAGAATCGGGHAANATATPQTLIAPTVNSGGGGGSLSVTAPLALRQGAAGVVVVRWNAPTVTLSFTANGHGAAVAPETVLLGSPPTKPADPSESGFFFTGWYADAALTTTADFSAPLTASTTFYEGWMAAAVAPVAVAPAAAPKPVAVIPTLAATGGGPNPWELPAGLASLAAGAVLVAVGYRRKNFTN